MPYIKEVFDVQTFEQAKHVVLSTDSKNPNKFEHETKFLVDVVQKEIEIDENSVILDFGCGMGRISKELISRFNAKVIGLDISPSMLQFAKIYISNIKKFEPTHSYSTPSSVDYIFCILSLQHAENPKNEIDNLYEVLKPNGTLILLNENKRYVPSGVDRENYVIWDDDKFDVFNYLNTKLTQISSIPYVDNRLHINFYRKLI